MKLIIGNRAYSSWSMRGWLACKQTGEVFEELGGKVDRRRARLDGAGHLRRPTASRARTC